MAVRRGISKDTVYFKIPALMADIVVMVTIFEIALRIIAPTMDAARFSDVDDLFAIPSLALLLVAYGVSLAALRYNHHIRKVTLPSVVARSGLRTMLTAFVFTVLVAVQFKVVPRRFILLNFTMTGVVLCGLHVAFAMYIRHLRQIGRNTVPVVIVGLDPGALDLYSELHYGLGIKGYRVQGFFADRSQKDSLPSDAAYLGDVTEVVRYIEEKTSGDVSQLSEVYCSISPAENTELVNSIIRTCERRLVTFYYVQNRDKYTSRPLTRHDIGNVTVLRAEDDNAGVKLPRLVADILENE